MKRLLPAYPLFVKDPYFSIWSPSEKLNESNVIFWTGAEKKVFGAIKVEGQTYCFLGKLKGAEKAEQTDLSVAAFSTDYTFTAGKVQLKLSFVSPLPPDDLSLASCPVCYVKYEITGAADAEIFFAVHQSVCYNEKTVENEVRGGAFGLGGFRASFFGLSRQTPLSQNDDGSGADWGYYYLTGEQAYFADEEGFLKFVADGSIPAVPARESDKYIISSCRAKKGKFMLAFDDTVSINYFGDFLKGYYLEDHTVTEALVYVNENVAEIDAKLDKFEKRLLDAAKGYGEEYINVLNASLRQSVGAHKIVRDREGRVLFLSKECHSNGCIATVDVSYPSMPLYLMFNPELVRGMLRPIFRFASLPVWPYDFAPHDAGTYPNCTGQVYGLNDFKDSDLRSAITCFERQTRFPLYVLPDGKDVYCFENQMPVEECANVLIMLAACLKEDGKLAMLKENFSVMSKWADYLAEKGLKPENQLCTDDFAGHLGNNINLAIKATVGIACFAEICTALGREAEYDWYRRIAEDFAGKISACVTGDHMPLTWEGGEQTFSLKYNLAFDKILGLGLFDKKLCEMEADYYISHMNAYGTPLDSRADYSKSDWLIWAACLTDDMKKRKILISALDKYLKETPTRVPFSDWYDTVTGKSVGFTNRTVQGGCFILLLGKL